MSGIPHDPEELAAALLNRLARGLPGLNAQKPMVPRDRPMTGLPVEEYRRAAVLIALYRAGGSWRLPLILRTDSGRYHSGQVSFPGGRLKPRETDEQAALREAHEEIGLAPAAVEVIGQLTPVPIPVSRHQVQPVLGLLAAPPERWRPQPSEVEVVFTVTVDNLLDPSLRRAETMETVAGPMKVPYYALGGHKVWGATAIILAELAEIIEGISQE